jgi:hypothetical protein
MENWIFNYNSDNFDFGGGEEFIEVANFAALPVTGESGVIYVTLDTNKLYRWTGSTYVEVSSNNADDYILEFKNGSLTTTIDAPYNGMKINSVTNVSNSPTTTITTGVGLTPYVLGTAINLGTIINITVSTASTIRLNSTKE